MALYNEWVHWKATLSSSLMTDERIEETQRSKEKRIRVLFQDYVPPNNQHLPASVSTIPTSQIAVVAETTVPTLPQQPPILIPAQKISAPLQTQQQQQPLSTPATVNRQ